MSWYYITPTQAIKPELVWSVSINAKQVTWTTSNGAQVKHLYPTELDAQQAYIAFITDTEPPAKPIQVGDEVRLRGSGNRRTQENVSYTVAFTPHIDFPFWGLLGTNTNHMYIFELGSDIWLEKLP